MDTMKKKIEELKGKFESCRGLLTAIGDENRQLLLCMMMESSTYGGRVVDIAKRTNLSRPAVSHHMQILKNAGLVMSKKEGTLVFYYLIPDDKVINRLVDLVANMAEAIEMIPNCELKRGD